MLWRKLKLDWSYAIGELIIVTVGVLIALAIDEWNTDRGEQNEERKIIERLITDVQRDIEIADRALERLDRKLQRLNRLKSHLERGIESVNDPQQFIVDFWYGQVYGWGQDRSIQPTFNELTNSGDFGLLRNSELRREISQYYFFRAIEAERMDERETELPRIVYRLIPYSVTRPDSATYFGEPSYETLVKRVFAEDVSDELLAEMNYAYFARRDFSAIRRKAEQLSASLNNELGVHD